MSDLWFKIKQIITLVVFVAVLSLLGMISGRPIMIVAYGVFFSGGGSHYVLYDTQASASF